MNLEEQVEALQDQLQELRALESHPGYVRLVNQLSTVLGTKTAEITQPPAESFPESARAYIAGEMRTLTFCLNLIPTMITGSESSLRALEMKLNLGDGNE